MPRSNFKIESQIRFWNEALEFGYDEAKNRLDCSVCSLVERCDMIRLPGKCPFSTQLKDDAPDGSSGLRGL